MQRDIRVKAAAMAVSLSDHEASRRARLFNGLREQAAVAESALFDLAGNVLLVSSESKTVLAPRIPTGEMLQGLRRQRDHARVETGPSGSMVVRVLVPVNTASGEILGLQLAQPVPDDIARDAEAVHAAYGEFQELMYSRPGLKRLYGLSLTLALLLALFSSLLLAIYFSERLSAPLGLLAEATRAVAQGDFRQRTPVKSHDELRLLTGSFNAMTRDLADAQSASQRYQRELEAAKSSLESILSNLSAGVIALDHDGRPRSANPSASAILGVDFALLREVPLARWAEVQGNLTAIAEPLAAMLAQPRGRTREKQITFPGLHGELALLLKVSELAQPTDTEYVVVFDDITNLLRAQRHAAWGEVARRLAHEIKNPLTPIQLSAERLEHRLHAKLDAADGDLLSRLTRTIVAQVTSLKQMVDAFSRYARSPEADLQPLELIQLVNEVLSLYETPGRRIPVRTVVPTAWVLADAAKLRQVILNLLSNAEDSVSSVQTPQVVVAIDRVGGQVALRVSDNGAGFPPEMLGRPIEPYVTTKAKGTGLGLAIVQKIVDEHGGTIVLENQPQGGARVSVLLPMSDAVVAGLAEGRPALMSE
jgi:nitrogen fixation/metabolism regulation signal transduction histidine kinase